MAKILDAIIWAVRSFIAFIDSFESIPFLLRWVIVFALIALVIFLVGHIIYTLYSAVRPVQIPLGGLDHKQRRILDPQEFEQQADQLAREGKLIESILNLL